MVNKMEFEEDLSISYLRAIAAQAEVTFELHHRDEFSDDVVLTKQVVTKSGKNYISRFCVQLKATINYIDDGTTIKYDLRKKNYDDLISDSSIDTILCLMILPKKVEERVEQSVDKLILKKCMYWYSLRGADESSNAASVRIDIPKKNILTPTILNEMMQILAEGERL